MNCHSARRGFIAPIAALASLLCLILGIVMGSGLGDFRAAGAETKSTNGVIRFEAREITQAFEKGGMIQTTPEHKVMAGHRDKAGIPELHDADTDIFYIVDGEATFITGGKIIEPKLESPGETRGSRIEGGETHKLTKGMVLVIPRGVPHWFSEVPKLVNYFVVKVTAEKKAK